MAYRLTGKQRKNADRVGGIELMIPWPRSLPPPKRLTEDTERDATEREDRVCRALIDQDDLQARGLVQVRTAVTVVERPHTLPEPGVAPHLVAVIIGHRWVHATGRPYPHTMWAPRLDDPNDKGPATA